MPDAIIIGGGVIGTSIAYHLARAGMTVTLTERTRSCGLYAAPSATWASAGGLRAQGRATAEASLSVAAAKRWKTLSEELDADLEVRFGGHLHVAESADEVAGLEKRVVHDRVNGIAVEMVDGARVREIAPGLTDTAVAAAYTPDDGQAHPGRTAAAFSVAASRLGAEILVDTPVKIVVEAGHVAGVGLPDGTMLRADIVVVAAGAWSIELLQSLGPALPVRYRALQMLLSDVAPPTLAPTVTAAGRNLSLKQSPSGQFMIGGNWASVPPPGFEVACDPALVRRQWCEAVGILPGLASRALAQTWAGVECQSIDALPVIGRWGLPGLYLAMAFSNHGFQISPAIGACVAREITGTPIPELAAFRVERFADVGPSAIVDFVIGE